MKKLMVFLPVFALPFVAIGFIPQNRLAKEAQAANKRYLYLIAVTALMFLLVSRTASAQSAISSAFATGLRAPVKIITTPAGNLLVAEAGNGPNSGRISIFDLNGNRRTLLDGLPSGFAPPNNDPSGPSGLALRGRTLFVVISEGDETLNGAIPGTNLPNPNPASPFFSSVLAIRLSPQAEDTTPGFAMTFADQLTLQNRGFLRLTDAAGNELLIQVATNFPNFTNDFPTPAVRHSDPFAIAVKDNLLYVVDAGQNLVYEVDSRTGATRTLISFPARANPLPLGPPFIDAVPNSIRLLGNSLLVSLLTGFPFPPGAAEVRKIRLANDADEPFIGGLSSAIDVLPAKNSSGQDQFYTLEFSTNMLTNAPGRLSRFDQPNGSPVVLLNNLISPTSMARDETTGNLFVTEIFTGRVIRVQVP